MNTRNSIFMMAATLSLTLATNTRAASISGTEPDSETHIYAEADSLGGLLGEYFMVKWVPVGGSNYVADTVSHAYEHYIATMNDPEMVEANADYYKLFLPLTYFNSSIEQYSTVDKVQNDGTSESDLMRSLLPIDEQTFTTKDRIDTQVNGALLSAYVNDPAKVLFTEDEINKGGTFEDRLEEQQEDLAKVTAEILDVKVVPQEVTEDAVAEITKPNWWKFTGNGSFQMSQNYISDNWYKGGESNVAEIATLQLKADYNDNEKVQWENMLDAKLGVASSPSDQYHDYLVNTDLLRLYSKFGVQAAKHWYYTIAGEAKTQFMESYGSNSQDMKAAFLAPLDVNVSLGMDYKLEKPNFKFSVMIAPITWTMRYIGNDGVSHKSYGLDEDKNTRHNIGSEILPTFTWNIAKNITWESRLDYLTSYTWTRIDWENTFNFAVNKYLSTKFYVHARMDDSAEPRSGSRGDIQVNELFSFGINYTW